MASRDTRSCSLPLASSWASSVIAGTWRSRRSASKRRCSSALAVHGSCVVQPIWPSMSLMNWPILAAAASACSRWMRVSACLFSWYENQISNRPLVRSATQTTATNSATYFRNSRLPTWVAALADSRRIRPSAGPFRRVLAISLVVIRSPCWAWFAALPGKLHDQAVRAEGSEGLRAAGGLFAGVHSTGKIAHNPPSRPRFPAAAGPLSRGDPFRIESAIPA